MIDELMIATYRAVADLRIHMRTGISADRAAILVCREHRLTPESRYSVIQLALEAERACQNARVWIRSQRSKGKIRGKH